MPNGLLTNLTEAWEPTAGGILAGKKSGLDTGTDASISYVTQAGFPGGHALQINGTGSVTLASAASALLSQICATSFLGIFWCYNVTGVEPLPYCWIGEGNENGIDWGADNIVGPEPADIFAEMPGIGASYACKAISTPDTPYTAGVNMLAAWYEKDEETLYTSRNGGTAYSLLNTTGVGAQDLTNALNISFGSNSGISQIGGVYVWQGTQAVANAVSQLSSLYADKLQFSDFDDGSGGGGGSVARASRLSLSLGLGM